MILSYESLVGFIWFYPKALLIEIRTPLEIIKDTLVDEQVKRWDAKEIRDSEETKERRALELKRINHARSSEGKVRFCNQ